MNSNTFDMNSLTVEIDCEESKSIDNDQLEDDNTNTQQSSTHVSRSSVTSTSSTTTTNNQPSKRPKDISPCYVCGAKAHGYNFDQSIFLKNSIKFYLIYLILVTCESCKAFFRRNALKSMVNIPLETKKTYIFI
jgi:hypothetical protein